MTDSATDMFAGGERGSADSARDPRGFAVKFYTEEGNWDLVGNNTPIFFIRDTILVSLFSQLCILQNVCYLAFNYNFSCDCNVKC